MSRQWGLVYEVGIWLSGGFVIFSISLAWARYLKKWWQREQVIRDIKGDAND